ncbi:MAG: hypothetical protein IPN29_11775 [Saprospiraceae bacterium]|nr:hypothetical protein [Saprospiraceae bacterium]
MKKFVCITALLLSYVFADAQNPDYTTGVSFKTLFLDYQSQQGGSLESFKDYHHGFEFGFQKKISRGLSLAIPFKFGTVEEYNTATKRSDLNKHKQIASLDAQFQYHLYNGGNNIVPYLMAGAGGVMEFEGDFNVQVPLGVGVNFKAAKNAYINLQAEYRYSFLENRNNLQYGLGFIYLWGAKKDSMAVSTDNEVPEEDKMKVDENKEDEVKRLRKSRRRRMIKK